MNEKILRAFKAIVAQIYMGVEIHAPSDVILSVVLDIIVNVMPAIVESEGLAPDSKIPEDRLPQWIFEYIEKDMFKEDTPPFVMGLVDVLKKAYATEEEKEEVPDVFKDFLNKMEDED